MAAAGPRLGIDFGTSHTVALIAWPDGRVRPLLFDGSPLLPSSVYAQTDGAVLVGRDAVHAARVDPARFEASPKRRIDDGTVLLGDREVTVPALIGAVLSHVTQEATRVAGGPVSAVTMTHPAAWGVSRRLALVEGAKLAGLPQPALMPEPVAAAHYFAGVLRKPLDADQGLLVYDFGGGTFDASIVTRAGEGFDVRAVDGIDDLGGLDLDALILDYAKQQLADPDVWGRLESPQTTEDRRHRRLLWDDARIAKEMLSRTATTGLHVPILAADVTITRDAFEERARPLLEQTVRTTAGVIRWAGLDKARLAGVFLVGGSSRIPQVATLLERELGLAPTIIEQPELVVAEGSLRAWVNIGAQAASTAQPVSGAPGGAGAAGAAAAGPAGAAAAGAGAALAGAAAAQAATPSGPTPPGGFPQSAQPAPVAFQQGARPQHGAPGYPGAGQPGEAGAQSGQPGYPGQGQSGQPGQPGAGQGQSGQPGAGQPGAGQPGAGFQQVNPAAYHHGPATPTGAAAPVSALPMSGGPVSGAPVSAAPVSPVSPYQAGQARPVSSAPVSPVGPGMYGADAEATQPIRPSAPIPAPAPAPVYISPAATPAVYASPSLREEPPTPPPPSRPRRNLAVPMLVGLLVLALALAGYVVFRDRNTRDKQGATSASTTPSVAPQASRSPRVIPQGYRREQRPFWVPEGWRQMQIGDVDDVWRNQEESEGGRCEATSETLHVTTVDKGLTGCTLKQPLDTGLTDSAIEAKVHLTSGCAGMWLRTGDKGYVLAYCADGNVRIHRLGDAAPSQNNTLAEWTYKAESDAYVAFVVNGTTLNFYIGGVQFGPVSDVEILKGRTNLGAFASTGVADVEFSDVRVFTPQSSTNAGGGSPKSSPSTTRSGWSSSSPTKSPTWNPPSTSTAG
ncbi:Hsp70 family protein [Dactylosporangium roseum]|uniref:Hsp70 family protein n=1 Tax=Dactylosporangium roseum TaxID=47989 RepID=A0ABY5Z019_9ACTN|nr:Hsp70 family protein [Dactylosporangium roseum]UWZ35379.1 Hsp70 family protein [Dactylosporangium roseum]